MIDRRHLILGSGALALAACSQPGQKAGGAAGALRIGVVAKALGNPFFNAVEKGANQAAAEIGGVTINFTAPQASTAEGQIDVLNSLIAQNVDAIAISATDPDAVHALCAGHARLIEPGGFDADGRWLFLLVVCHHRAFFATALALTPDGLLEMVADDMLVDTLPVRSERMDGLFAILDTEETSP